MIFSRTRQLLLSGRKTQTLRLADVGDYLWSPPGGPVHVMRAPFKLGDRTISRPRWIVGHTYAIQPERCHHALGRFRCTYLREVLNPLEAATGEAGESFVRAEGFDTAQEFLDVWHQLHRSDPVQRCWAIGMELIEVAGKVRVPA